MFKILFISTLFAVFSGCNSGNDLNDLTVSQEFSDHWYAGNAEVASYDLKQSRYGEEREGHAVLIFVTEPFSKSHHVKLDNPEAVGSDKVSVLKLNMTKKFVTGIYPYSMMLSVFSPADTQNPPRPLKYTMSSQEWCGHVYSQINRNQDAYEMQQYSYFQSEGDKTADLPGGIMEDEIWNLIRLAPDKLPQGEIEIYPGLFFTRLLHKPMQAELAMATLKGESGEKVYTIEYSSGRRFEWRFTAVFPHQINSWKEEFPGRYGKTEVNSATFKKSLFLPYWQFNGQKDIILRDSLGI